MTYQMVGDKTERVAYHGHPDMTNLPIQSGKTVLITGGTSGLGHQMVTHVAALNPPLVVFTGRNQARADEILAELGRKHPHVQIKFARMDLASLRDTQRALQYLEPQLAGRLDLLVCNAGIMAHPPGLSPEGYEIQWATDYLGHALLTRSLLSLLTATASSHGDAGIVNITSGGLMLAPPGGIVFDDLKTKQEYGFGARWRRYDQSELAQALYTSSIGQRQPTVSSIAIHPGVAGTDLVNTLSWADRLLVYATTKVLSPEDGCKNSLWGATALKRDVKSGVYYAPIGEPGKKAKWTKNRDLAEKLWVKP